MKQNRNAIIVKNLEFSLLFGGSCGQDIVLLYPADRNEMILWVRILRGYRYFGRKMMIKHSLVCSGAIPVKSNKESEE